MRSLRAFRLDARKARLCSRTFRSRSASFFINSHDLLFSTTLRHLSILITSRQDDLLDEAFAAVHRPVSHRYRCVRFSTYYISTSPHMFQVPHRSHRGCISATDSPSSQVDDRRDTINRRTLAILHLLSWNLLQLSVVFRSAHPLESRDAYQAVRIRFETVCCSALRTMDMRNDYVSRVRVE
jgi:hypothetical protein